MPDTALYLLAALAYLGLAAWLWPGRPGERNRALSHLLPLVPLALHLILLQQDVLGAGGVSLGLASSLSAIAALTVLIYSLACWLYPIAGLTAFVLAFAGVTVLLHAVLPAAHMIPYSEQPLFRLHLLMAMTAYSLFTIAALHAVLIALADHHLHKPVPPALVAGLPPLLTLEKLLFNLIEAGFVLLTLTLVSGIVFSEAIFGKPLPLNHKTVFGVVSWLIFAALLWGRRSYGWRGQRAILWTLAGFVSLLLAYVGVQFVLEMVLHRI